MARHKNSIAKEISKTDSTELQHQKAKLGKLHHMSEEAEALETILSERSTRCFWKGGISPHEICSRQSLCNALMKAIDENTPNYFREFAELLEVIDRGRDVSPIEGFIARLKFNQENPPEEGQISDFFDSWPFTISKIKNLCFEATGKEYSTEAVRAAANRIGVPYSEGRGRPAGQEN